MWWKRRSLSTFDKIWVLYAQRFFSIRERAFFSNISIFFLPQHALTKDLRMLCCRLVKQFFISTHNFARLFIMWLLPLLKRSNFHVSLVEQAMTDDAFKTKLELTFYQTFFGFHLFQKKKQKNIFLQIRFFIIF